MEIIVGRKGEQPFLITDKGVSGKHLKLVTLPDGSVQVEDLGSTNGTFIDGIRIIKKIVNRNSVIQLGPRYTLKISDVFPEPNLTKTNQNTSQPVKEYSIAHLEEVWNQYISAKDELDNQNRNILLMRSATPMLSLIPGLGAVLGTYSFYKTKKFNYKDALNEVQERFEDSYVCPKCHHFLGVVKYKLLIQDTNCRFCKCRWIIR